MKILLPDNSFVFLDRSTFRFYPEKVYPRPEFILPLNYELLKKYLEQPEFKFGECFRRVNATPKYAPIQSKHEFQPMMLRAIYHLPTGKGSHSSMFASAKYVYPVLDGCIIDYQGYGWGHKSWQAVEGYETLRATCLFNGIKQPLQLKGEKHKRSLGEILIELSENEINHHLYLPSYHELKTKQPSLN